MLMEGGNSLYVVGKKSSIYFVREQGHRPVVLSTQLIFCGMAQVTPLF